MTAHDPALHRRIAIIVDAENVPLPVARQLIESVRPELTVCVMAVADWTCTNLAPYATAPASLGLRLMQCFPKVTGGNRKSRSDFAICGEAISMLHAHTADEILILSNDQDFDSFISSCGYPRQIRRMTPPAAKTEADHRRDAALKALLKLVPENDGVALNVLGKTLKAKEFGFASLTKLAQQFPKACRLSDGKVYRALTA